MEHCASGCKAHGDGKFAVLLNFEDAQNVSNAGAAFGPVPVLKLLETEIG